MDEEAEERAQQHQKARGSPHLSFERNRFLSPDDGQVRFGPSKRAPKNIHNILKSESSELLTRLLATATRLTNDVKVLVTVPVSRRH